MARKLTAKKLTNIGPDDEGISSRYLRSISEDPSKETIGNDGAGEVPYKLGESSNTDMPGKNKFPSGGAASNKGVANTSTPTESLSGTTNYGRQLEASKYNLHIDNGLRGNVNRIVEDLESSNNGINWSNISSITYGSVPKIVDLNKFPSSLQANGVVVYYANTPTLKAQGLQHVDGEEFPDNAVMVFYRTASSPFHMRNVKFPLDILFLSGDNKVIGMRRMRPDNQLYYPPAGTINAVEVKPGFIENYKITIGTNITNIIGEIC